MKTFFIPDNFDGFVFESLAGYPASSPGDNTINNVPDEWTDLSNCVVTDPDWTGFRQALYLSNDWYRVKNSAPVIASELMLLLWNYQQDPSLESEIASTIAALKIAANVTEDEKLAIAAIMETCHIPQTFIDVVLGGS